MDMLATTISNYIIGTLGSMPSMDVDSIDLSGLIENAPYINYFVPFYIISPLLKTWAAALGAIIGVMTIWGFIKRNF